MAIKWRDDAPSNLVKLAVGRCMIAVMDDGGRWRELGLLTDTTSLIDNHPRLLRSLHFGDDDYDGHVLAMVGDVLGEWQPDPWGPRPDARTEPASVFGRFQHLEAVSDFIDLPVWLAENDEGLFNRLFHAEEEDSTMPDGTVLSAAEAAASRLQVGEMRRQIERIRRDHSDDPEAAIGQAKELVETTCKTILGLTGDGPETNEDVPKLVTRTLVHLGLDPAAVKQAGGDVAEARALKRLLGGVSSILTGTAELRNARGTGHGKSGTPLVDAAVARLTVGLVLPAVVFLIETHEARTDPGAAEKQIVARRSIRGLRVGVVVRHDSFGEGLVEEVAGEGNKAVATVNFGEAGAKRLLVRYAPLSVVSS